MVRHMATKDRRLEVNDVVRERAFRLVAATLEG
jgi:hypothetical protein